MQFGLFGSAAARRGGPEFDSSEGFPRLHRIQYRGRGARLSQHLCRRAPFHRLWPGLGDAQPVDLARRAHPLAAARHGGHRAALAQPGAAGRAGRDPRSACPAAGSISASARAIATTSSPDSACRWKRPTRGSTRPRRHPQGMDRRRAVFPSRQVLAIRQHRRRAADRAEAAPADLDGGRRRALDPPRRAAGLQPAARPICLARGCRADRSRSSRTRSRPAAAASIRCRSGSPARSSSPTARPRRRPRWSGGCRTACAS